MRRGVRQCLSLDLGRHLRARWPKHRSRRCPPRPPPIRPPQRPRSGRRGADAAAAAGWRWCRRRQPRVAGPCGALWRKSFWPVASTRTIAVEEHDVIELLDDLIAARFALGAPRVRRLACALLARLPVRLHPAAESILSMAPVRSVDRAYRMRQRPPGYAPRHGAALVSHRRPRRPARTGACRRCGLRGLVRVER